MLHRESLRLAHLPNTTKISLTAAAIAATLPHVMSSVGRVWHRARSSGLAMVVALGLGAFPSTAAASCQPPRADQGGQAWYAGTMKTPSALPRNIKADIVEYNPYYEEGPLIAAWTMLNTGGSLWVQTGWYKSCSW